MFNEKLHELRLQKQITAQYMADSLGISIRAYRFYESGSREPNLKTLVKIADILNVSTDVLLCRNFPEASSGEH